MVTNPAPDERSDTLMTRQAAKIALFLAALSPSLFARPSIKAETPAPRLDLHGDALPDGVLTRLGTVRFRLGQPVTTLAYVQDGKQLATLSQDGQVRLYDAESGKEVRRLDVSNVGHLAASPDGSTLAVGGNDGSVTVWEAATGKRLQQWGNTAQGIASLAFLADGKRILARDNTKAVHLWDVSTGKHVRRFDPPADGAQPYFQLGYFASVGLLADGKTIATGTMRFEDNQLKALLFRWELETGKLLDTLATPGNGMQSLVFSPDSTRAATCANDGILRLIDPANGKEVRTLTATAPLYANLVRFSPDGKTIAAYGHDHSIQLWNVADGKELLRFRVSNPGVGANYPNLTFAPDGKTIAAATSSGAVRQWNVSTGKEHATIEGHTGAVLAVAVSADGKTVATRGNDGLVSVWDAATGKTVSSLALPANVTHSAFDAAARTLITAGADGMVRVHDLAEGKEVRQWQANAAEFTGFMALGASADGRLVATRGNDPMMRIWDSRTGKELHAINTLVPGPNGTNFLPMYYGGGTHLVFSPDGSVLAVLGGNNQEVIERRRRCIEMPMNTTLQLWDVATGKPLRKLEVGPTGASTFAFSPDGRTIAVSTHDNAITLWETASGLMRFRFTRTGGGALTTLAYTPDGKLLAGSVAEFPDAPILFWDPVAGKELPTLLKGHRNMVASLTFTPDGKRLISGGQDTTALLWDVAGLQPEPELVEVSADKTDALWTDLAGADAQKAYAAVRALSQSPRQGTALMQERLKAIPIVDEKMLTRLVADLDSNTFVVRQKATAELEKLGEVAEPALLEALTIGPTLEVKQRIDRLLEKLVSTQAPPAEEMRALRALEVLEQLGTPEARAIVETMAKGATGSKVTRNAKLTLARLGK